MTAAAASGVVTFLFTDVESVRPVGTAAMVTYAYDQIDQARTELNTVENRPIR